MLAQDYVLKQLVSSLTYPESEVGKSYWQKAYQAAAKPWHYRYKLDTFNKIWIAPDKAEVYEYKNTAVVNQATLKAMLEEDFVALNKNVKSVGPVESVEPVVGLKSSNRLNQLNRQLLTKSPLM